VVEDEGGKQRKNVTALEGEPAAAGSQRVSSSSLRF